jgi:uncharacterized Tic20 family protein
MSDDPSTPPPYDTTPTSPTPPPPPPPAASSVAPPVGVAYETPGLGPVETNEEAKTWGMVAHLSALIGFTGVPSVVGPLIVWAIKKDTMPFVNDQAKEAMNFNITVLIAILVCIPTFCIGIGFVLLPIIGIAALVFMILAALKAKEGVAYRYPFTLRLIK